MGLLGTLSRGTAGDTGGTLNRLCRENGYSIFNRSGNGIALEFQGDSITPERHIIVVHPEGDKLMGFTALCRAKFTASTMPPKMMPCLLMHNEEIQIGGWYCEEEDGTFSFKLRYTALAAGVDAATFKGICTLMIKEVAEIEAELVERGVL